MARIYRYNKDRIIKVVKVEDQGYSDSSVWGEQLYGFTPRALTTDALPLQEGDELLLIRKSRRPTPAT